MAVLVGSDCCVDPVNIVADFGVDAWVALQSTPDAPGDNALEDPIANHGATGITLGDKGRKTTQDRAGSDRLSQDVCLDVRSTDSLCSD